MRAGKVTRRPGNVKPAFVKDSKSADPAVAAQQPMSTGLPIAEAVAPEPLPKMNGDAKHSIIPPVYSLSELSESQRTLLLKRPLIDSKEMLGRVQPILNEVSVHVFVKVGALLI